MKVFVQQDVLRLQISVGDILIMQELKCKDNLSNNVSACLNWNRLTGRRMFNLSRQTSTVGILQEEVKIFFILKSALKRNDIFMLTHQLKYIFLPDNCVLLVIS